MVQVPVARTTDPPDAPTAAIAPEETLKEVYQCSPAPKAQVPDVQVNVPSAPFPKNLIQPGTCRRAAVATVSILKAAPVLVMAMVPPAEARVIAPVWVLNDVTPVDAG
jgi:hypothetical protein